MEDTFNDLGIRGPIGEWTDLAKQIRACESVPGMDEHIATLRAMQAEIEARMNPRQRNQLARIQNI